MAEDTAAKVRKIDEGWNCGNGGCETRGRRRCAEAFGPLSYRISQLACLAGSSNTRPKDPKKEAEHVDRERGGRLSSFHIAVDAAFVSRAAG